MGKVGKITGWAIGAQMLIGLFLLGTLGGVRGAWWLAVVLTGHYLGSSILRLVFREGRLEYFRDSIPPSLQVVDVIVEWSLATYLAWAGHWGVGIALLLANALQKVGYLMVRRASMEPGWKLNVTDGPTTTSRCQSAWSWISGRACLVALAWVGLQGQEPFSRIALAALLWIILLIYFGIFLGQKVVKSKERKIERALSPSVGLLLLSLFFHPAAIGWLYWAGHPVLGTVALLGALFQLLAWNEAWPSQETAVQPAGDRG